MSNSVADRLAKKTRRKAPAKQVRLKLVYVNYLSAMKFSFILSLCFAIVMVVTTLLVYTVLLSTGVLADLDELLTSIVGSDESILAGIGLPQVFTFALIVGVLNIIVGTVLGAIGALIYNLLVRVLGGFQLGFTSN